MANMPRKLDGKELENAQIQALIDGVRRRLARLEAEAEAAANRYTVVFEMGPRNIGGAAMCWRARAIEADLVTVGETLEEAAVLMARKLSSLRASIGKEQAK